MLYYYYIILNVYLIQCILIYIKNTGNIQLSQNYEPINHIF